MSKAIFEGNEGFPVFNNFFDALSGIYELAQKEKLIFVIDEFSYLAQSEKSILSILQQFIDLKSQAEIDFIAHSEDMEQAIFGECKWRNELLDKGVIDELMEKCKMFKQFKQKYYYLFSKSGFTLGAQEHAFKTGNVRLIDFKDMYE